MTDESREELISAYLDGELTADERARVETWLAESAELRQLYDELRAIKGCMRSLERHKLDRDLSSAVLRRAEQAVLRGAESNPVAGSIAPARAAASWWNRGGWRRAAWPAVAIAAALLILVFNARQTGVEREVARAPQQSKPAAEIKDLDANDDATPNLNLPVKLDEGEISALKSLPKDHAAAGSRAARMSQNAKPSAAAPPAEPAVGGAAPPEALNEKESFAPFAAQADPARRLILEVSPQFLQDRSFEKLLDEMKLKWERVDPKKSRDDARKSKAETRLQTEYFASPKAPSANYVVEIPQDRVDETLDQLGKKSRQLGRLADELAGVAPPQSGARSAGATRRVFIMLVPPALPSAPPASPAAADKP